MNRGEWVLYLSLASGNISLILVVYQIFNSHLLYNYLKILCIA